MCGRPYDQCTKEAFMEYLGVGNPATPFPIHINLTNDTRVPDSYFNQTTFLCNEGIETEYEETSPCSCLVNFLRNSFLDFIL